ncbi:hypothetical protein ACHAWF_011201 [Thalassiosira exigua]
MTVSKGEAVDFRRRLSRPPTPTPTFVLDDAGRSVLAPRAARPGSPRIRPSVAPVRFSTRATPGGFGCALRRPEARAIPDGSARAISAHSHCGAHASLAEAALNSLSAFPSPRHSNARLDAMPSRKRAQGKARKAEQAMRDEVRDLRASFESKTVGELRKELADLGGDPSLHTKKEDLIDAAVDAHFLVGKIKMKTIDGCPHGMAFMSADCNAAWDDYIEVVKKLQSIDGVVDVRQASNEAVWSSIAKFPNVWEDNSEREALRVYLVVHTINLLLRRYGRNMDDLDEYRMNACLYYPTIHYILFIENFEPNVELDAESDLHSAICRRTYEILTGSQRATVKFFHQRAACSCLDHIYSHLKAHSSKWGMCSKCKKVIEVRDLKGCRRCNMGYCSKECQQAHWPVHKNTCNYWSGHNFALKTPTKAFCPLVPNEWKDFKTSLG